MCPSAEPLVVEIGPGRGALTEKLLARAGRVVAVEIDSELVAHLRDRFAGEPRLEILNQDVLETDLSRWGTAPLAGNLPYYITSPILERAARSPASRAVFLVQKEVAERIAAQPGSRDYGFLTVQLALWRKTRRLFDVKPGAFRPPPKVESSVVVLDARSEGTPPDAEAFLEFAAQAFRHKRKTIRNNLAPIYGKSIIDAWPEADRRAEQISLEGFQAMWQRVRAR